ncbi:TPR repeat [Geitlerinema sp. FC II]|nr:hypothetical protein [Geitlerinema sp. CS-897]PPT04914.1 TPR repeat [Geitlerinema sp. FC II]
MRNRGAIAQLDLVISVDTSVAHLAGVMGKPVWMLLCHRCDWQWMCDRVSLALQQRFKTRFKTP